VKFVLREFVYVYLCVCVWTGWLFRRGAQTQMSLTGVP